MRLKFFDENNTAASKPSIEKELALTYQRCLLVISLLTCLVTSAFAVGPRDSQWKTVEDAMAKGLPKTAIEKLGPIIEQSLRDKSYAEAIKAISQKISLEGEIEGSKPEEKVTRMLTAIEKAPAEMQPVMEAILANWYWSYFQQNQWRFMQRTQTAAPPSDGFTTWDLSRILDEIDKRFQKALAAADVLKKTPIAEYDPLLQKGNSPDAYRPTLYDFLAHNAIEFYSAGEQAGAKAEDAFILEADSPIFSSVDDFVAWNPESTDGESATLKAIRLFQELLLFHRADQDKSAWLDADLLRLNFGNNYASGVEKTARYKAALKQFADKNTDHAISARALSDLATVVHGEGDFAEAHKIASEGMARFADSPGARRCFNLIQQIEARSCQISTERVWNKPLPTIDVRYRNLTKVYFKVVFLDFEAFVVSDLWSPEQLDEQQRRELLSQKPIKAWSADLPATPNFMERVESLAAPTDLKPGSYFLIASHNERFIEDDNQLSLAEFWVSELALVLRQSTAPSSDDAGTNVAGTNDAGTEGNVEGFVLNAITGEPISGANVRTWSHDGGQPRRRLSAVKTDKNGRFRVGGTERNSLVFHASVGGQTLSSKHHVQNQQWGPRQVVDERTVFFTDRALYRPGQTIHYKGICVAVDPERDNYKTIPDRPVTVVFLDVNGNEIERVSHRSNDYGSFSGSVTAPRDRLMGQMSIRIDGTPFGATSVTVEEYKRPKFQVSLDAPTEAPRLNSEVKLQGKGVSYTGAAVDGAKVRWRVVRQVRYPIWWYWRCWWMPQRSDSGQEIAHGTTVTQANGTFDVQFTAKPDPTASKEGEPTFNFTIYADVIDTSGETRSAQRSVVVGFTALKAALTANEWQTSKTPVEISLRTTTLDGEGQSTEGVLKIYAVKQPEKVVRQSLTGGQFVGGFGGDLNPQEAPASDPANPNSWPLGDVVFEQALKTDAGGNTKATVKLETGMYRAKYEAKDRFGKTLAAELPMQVIDPDAKKLTLKVANLVASPKSSVEPGEEFVCVWGSGYDTARAFVEVEHRGKLLQSYWTEPGTTQVAVKQKVTETMRGGFTLRITMVRENRAYLHSEIVNVPWSNKKLSFKWEHFVSKLEPAKKETWTLVITGSGAKQAAAELVAALYDASLDAFQPHEWMDGFNSLFRFEQSSLQTFFENELSQLQIVSHQWMVAQKDGSLTYRTFLYQIAEGGIGPRMYNRGFMGGGAGGMGGMPVPMAAAEMAVDFASMAGGMADKHALPAGVTPLRAMLIDASDSDAGGLVGNDVNAPTQPDLSKVSARKNLNETAFFFPHLIAGDDGTVRIEFTMPEALTEWKFLSFAHDKDLRSGLLTDKVVTAKDLMVQPNPPRFIREGDVIEFTAKVSNQSPTIQTGTAMLSLMDARTNQSVDDRIGNDNRELSFEIPAGESKSLSWRLTVPDDLGFLTYRIVGSTGKLSDGEEGFLPVLSRRILVTESLPLPIRGKQTKQFDFTKLSKSAESDTLKHQSLTVQMVSNPFWYAVLALPYLMEFPHECSEQTFSRLYANALAKHIASSDPKIHRVFEQWRGTPALDSPLVKNQDLKSVMIEETPWLQQAESESQSRRNVGVLFDDNRLNDETARLLFKLSEMQLEDGAWPWFPGGPANDYITLYITTGFGRLRHLGVEIDSTAALKSLTRLDTWVTEQHNRIPVVHRDKNQLTSTIALYLYGRSFFLDDQPIGDDHKAAVNYWLGQAKTHWLELGNRQSQGHLAIALKRFGELNTANEIMASIKEHSVSSEEMGMYWRDQEHSWWWYHAPIETQALMIEAFDEVVNDQVAVEDCKVWLLKQKQTQDWKTTKATADAVYALLLRGSDLLSSDELVEITLGGQTLKPANVEAGTGFYEQRFSGSDIKSTQSQIMVKKADDGVAWGSVHWQYFEEMSKVTPYEGTPLKLTKQIYTKQASKKGPELQLVSGAVEVGDELVVRIVLQSDRDMEYVHLKDYRGSGTEPVNVLSQYKYQDGLGYYESTRDTASHFFIDYLPKGTYVFEYSTRVQLRGQYQTGVASIQCMYAPEFNSHSESLPLEVK